VAADGKFSCWAWCFGVTASAGIVDELGCSNWNEYCFSSYWKALWIVAVYKAFTEITKHVTINAVVEVIAKIIASDED